jgi:hypothetical protein
MTIKQAIDIAIASGMTTFIVSHFNYRGKRYEQTLDTIYDFIKGYEDDIVITIYLGSASCFHGSKGVTYFRPTHCEIIFRGADENLPS